jgi:hypothetical protein
LLPAERPLRKLAMKRFLIGSISFFLLASAHAQAPEPVVEPNTLATVIFLGLFAAFCVGFIWMVWRNKDEKKKE